MEKTVIYKTCFGFECTTETNFNARILVCGGAGR